MYSGFWKLHLAQEATSIDGSSWRWLSVGGTATDVDLLLLISSAGNLLLGSCLTQHDLPYPLPDGLDCPEYGGQGLLPSTASTGHLWVKVAAMAHPWHPTGKPLS